MKIADSLEDVEEGLGVGLLPPLYGDQLEVLVEGDGGGSRVAAHQGHHVLGLRKKLFDSNKLDGVGPVDNRPSTNYLHYFVQFFERKK